MEPKLSPAYKSELTGHQVCVGRVLTYDPRLNIYSVAVVGIGVYPMAMATSGVVKPVPEGGRVVVCRVPGANWFILAELPYPDEAPAVNAATVDVQLADARSQVTTPEEIKDYRIAYRQNDKAGEGDFPVFPGDTVLQNRSRRNVTKSRIVLHEFGDILHFVSGFCYTLYHKARNAVVTRARNLYLFALGYSLEIITPPEGETNEGLTTTTEAFHSRALETPELSKKSGYISELPYVATVGQRINFGSDYVETDTGSGCLRGVVGGVAFSLGQFTHEISPNPDNLRQFTQSGAVGTSGLALKVGAKTILVNDETLTLGSDGSTVTLSPAGIVVQNTGQSFSLSPQGLTAQVTTFNVVSTGPISIKGPSIDLLN